MWRASRVLFMCIAGAASLLSQPGAASPSDELRALHEKVMRAHREGNVELLMEDEGPDYLVGNRGEISRPTLAQRRERLGSYLRATTFTEYRDLVEPVATTSPDGNLGWVVVQVQARGVQASPTGEKLPLEFTSAWIELYRKEDGRWLRVGNLSNFRP